MSTVVIVLPILTILMFDLGLTLRLEDFGQIVKHPRAMIVALIGQLVLLPLLAVGLAILFDFPPIFVIGMALIGCSPGGSSSNVFSKLAGGDVALSVTLTACSSIITLLTIPLVMSWVTAWTGDAIGVSLPVRNLVVQNVLLMLVPVVLGLCLNYARPELAQKIDRVLSKIAFPALMLLITVFFVQNYQTILDNIGRVGGCVTLLVLLAAGCAAAASRLTHLNDQQRRTVVIEVGMQNAAQAIAVATSPFIFASQEMAIPAVIYSLMMNVVLLSYLGLIKASGRTARLASGIVG